MRDLIAEYSIPVVFVTMGGIIAGLVCAVVLTVLERCV